MKAYQVINNAGYSASSGWENEAIFDSKPNAEAWREYLISKCDCEEPMTIKPVSVTDWNEDWDE